MASQFFEYAGVRIDLAEVEGFEKIVSHPVAFLRTRGGGIYVGSLTRDKINAALDAYRESLKPKYQFKDGWYIFEFNGIHPHVLRYVKDDVAYDASGCYADKATNYVRFTRVDFQPPPLDKFED